MKRTNGKFLIGIVIACLFGTIAAMAKINYAFMYKPPVLFNLFDIVIFGITALIAGLISPSLNILVLSLLWGQ